MTAQLDLARLGKIRTHGGKTIARCPACAESDGDHAGEHLFIDAAGRFGCVKFPGESGTEHRKRIFSLVGVVEKSTPAPAQRKARTYPTAEAAAKSITPPTGTLEAVYEYPRDGKPFAAVCRYRLQDGKTFRQFHADGVAWSAGAPAGKWPLYRLGELLTDGPVHIVEGEKCADAATDAGLNCTTSAGGAQAATKTDWQLLAGRDVRIWPDADEPGEQYAVSVAGILTTLTPAARVKIVRLPYEIGTGKDIADFLAGGNTAHELKPLIQAAPEWTAPAPQPAASVTTESDFPPIVSAASFTAAPMPEPAQVIHGVLHAGSKAVYGGPSKAFKSWSLLDMALAVSTGGDWLGFQTTRGRVLYVNFELQPFALHKRLHAISTARGCAITGNLDLWNLRGHGCPLTRLLPDLLRRVEGEGYSLIIPDPIYKTLQGRNENDAGDIGALCGELEAVAVKTGAAVAFGAHFAKGNASGKEAIDRVSGSGVWARDPDAIITATPHEEDSAFTVEMTLRNFPPPEPFVIRWEYPCMVRDGGLNPDKLRKPKNGRPASYTTADIMQHLADGMTSSQWQIACKEDGGLSMQTFYRLLGSAKRSKEAVQDGRKWTRGSL